MSTGSAAPAPFAVAPSSSWDGDDGRWSTFDISIGTPPQSFRVLPSTSGAEIWLPATQGCEGTLSNVPNCGTLRGVNNFNGAPSRGFKSTASSTWDVIGVYELATGQNLWGSSTYDGLYGLDTVSLEQYPSDKSVQLKSQTVAGISTWDVWLGNLGLGTAAANFSIESASNPTLLDTLQSQNMTPSLSFGYTAGASYSATPGSLIFGGYDQARFHPSGMSLPIGGYKDQNLPLNIESILAENTLFGGTVSLMPAGKPVTTIIDSSTAQMWLPKTVCDVFEQAFGLNYDSSNGLYLVNNTIHSKLEQLNPSVTFTLSGLESSTSTTHIVLPYAAFDLQAGIPLFNSTTNYFPLRIAANESQQVLGRAFLQEAYVFVDWERKNFTIGQAIHQNSTSHIVTVLPPASGSGTPNPGTGAIVGIAVGGCALILLLLGIATFFVMRHRRRAAQDKKDMPMELPDSGVQIYELQQPHPKHELVCSEVSELPAESLERELEGSPSPYEKVKPKWDVYELP